MRFIVVQGFTVTDHSFTLEALARTLFGPCAGFHLHGMSGLFLSDMSISVDIRA